MANLSTLKNFQDSQAKRQKLRLWKNLKKSVLEDLKQTINFAIGQWAGRDIGDVLFQSFIALIAEQWQLTKKICLWFCHTSPTISQTAKVLLENAKNLCKQLAQSAGDLPSVRLTHLTLLWTLLSINFDIQSRCITIRKFLIASMSTKCFLLIAMWAELSTPQCTYFIRVLSQNFCEILVALILMNLSKGFSIRVWCLVQTARR